MVIAVAARAASRVEKGAVWSSKIPAANATSGRISGSCTVEIVSPQWINSLV
jgi:hypothetical protein